MSSKSVACQLLCSWGYSSLEQKVRPAFALLDSKCSLLSPVPSRPQRECHQSLPLKGEQSNCSYFAISVLACELFIGQWELRGLKTVAGLGKGKSQRSLLLQQDSFVALSGQKGPHGQLGISLFDWSWPFSVRAFLDTQLRKQVYTVWKSLSEYTGQAQIQSLIVEEAKLTGRLGRGAAGCLQHSH